MTRPAINTSTAAIAALGIIGSAAILNNSATRIRRHRASRCIAEWQHNENSDPPESWVTVSGQRVQELTGLLVSDAPSCDFASFFRPPPVPVPRAPYAGGGLLAGFSGGYLLAKFLPWPGSPGGRFSTAPKWAAASIASLGLIGNAWTIYEIATFDECNLQFHSENFGPAFRPTLRVRTRDFLWCPDTTRDTAQKYAAGGLLVGISGGYLLATFLPRFQLPWPVAPVADTDTRTGAPLFGFAFTHPNARHRLELKTDMNAETAALHYRWRW